jgi:acyl-CoA dehydrogenase
VDFTFDETQDAVRDLAAQIFGGQSTVERVKEVEASDDRVDRKLWSELAKADLLGLVLPEADGGGGLGMVELALVLREQGRVVAPVPLLPTVLAARAIAEFGTAEQKARWLPGVIAGDVLLSLALDRHPATPPVAAADGRLTGSVLSVPYGHVADRVLVATDAGVFLVDPAAANRQVAEATDRSKVAHLTFAGAPAEQLGDDRTLSWLLDRYRTGLAAIQVGVCEAALEMTATYTSSRQQFGRPLSTNQGVALRAADAFIDIRAIDATLWQAAWRLDEGLDATRAAMVAKWWASDGGQRVVHATQHLHGGMGADIDYPIHRYFLWGKTIEQTLGGPSQQLAALGAELAEVTK